MKKTRVSEAETVLEPAAVSPILQLLQRLGGINFEDYKPDTVQRRIGRRMAVRQVCSPQEYLELLQHEPAEALALHHELLVPVTRFFRDPSAFAALAQRVIGPLVAHDEVPQGLRVWCAGVATGEEAYSVAMLFLEAFEQYGRRPSLKVFATDVEPHHIETATAGSYPGSIAAEVSAERLARFFERQGERFVVNSELRQAIVFARHDLLSDPPLTRMDLVVCRNTLIYFRPQAQAKVLQRLQYALGSQGSLFLGASESLGELQQDYQCLSTAHKIWRLTRAPLVPADFQPPLPGKPLPGALPRSPLAQPRRLGSDAVELGYQALLKGFGPPPAMLINAAHELVHAYGAITPLLQIREGQVSLDIHRLLPDALVPVATALLSKCAREGVAVSSDPVRIPGPAPLEDAGAAGQLSVKLTALPVVEKEGPRHTLLVFERQGAGEAVEQPVALDIASEMVERIAALEHELTVTRASLQAALEAFEASNEEMMAANEELHSSNEALQSVNQALNAVNARHREQLEILNDINADLDNLTKVVASGAVFVDDQLTLVRFSPEAATIFRLRDSDLGRPLDDLNHSLDYPDLCHDLRATLASGQLLEKDVGGGAGRHFMVRMLPYSIPSTSARGVVMSFVEVTKLHQARRLQRVIDALGENIAVLDATGRIVMVNHAWHDFAVANGDAEMRHSGPDTNYLDICRHAMASGNPHAERAYQGLSGVLSGQIPSFTMEYPCDAPDEPRWFVMNVNRLQDEQPGAVVSHVNITAWRRTVLAGM